MNFIIGILISIIGFIAASIHLKQGAESYWDFVAFSVVFCGTISVLVITRPKMRVVNLIKLFSRSLFLGKKNKYAFIKKCFLAISRRSFTEAQLNKIEEKIISDGFEMIDLGFTKDKIENILFDRFMAYKKSILSISSWIKRCAKYPPAFGLGGTVLGLIHLMKGISAGADPKETGIRMAVALVATFYGIILANLALNPIAEAIVEKLKSDEEFVELAIKTVLMLKEEYNLIECQEVFNSYLSDEKEKINFLNAASFDGEDFFADAA